MTYKIQIDNEVRDATPDEVARIEAFRADAQASEQASAAAATAGRAKLKALGLTDAEIAALVG